MDSERIPRPDVTGLQGQVSGYKNNIHCIEILRSLPQGIFNYITALLMKTLQKSSEAYDKKQALSDKLCQLLLISND